MPIKQLYEIAGQLLCVQEQAVGVIVDNYPLLKKEKRSRCEASIHTSAQLDKNYVFMKTIPNRKSETSFRFSWRTAPLIKSQFFKLAAISHSHDSFHKFNDV